MNMPLGLEDGSSSALSNELCTEHSNASIPLKPLDLRPCQTLCSIVMGSLLYIYYLLPFIDYV